MIDLDAPIVPWDGIGNIKLYSTIDELKKIIEDKDTRRFEYYENLVRYEVPGKIYMFFYQHYVMMKFLNFWSFQIKLVMKNH